MKPGKIEGATRGLAAPKDWDEEANGRCEVLEVRDVQDVGGAVYMQSAWLASDEEKVAIARGRPVLLTVWGHTHPPVSLGVALDQAPAAVEDVAPEAVATAIVEFSEREASAALHDCAETLRRIAPLCKSREAAKLLNMAGAQVHHAAKLVRDGAVNS